MKIGLFFGSFNPVHVGHVALAKHFLQCGLGLDEVWLVVSPQNPLKQVADLWDDAFRLQLVRMAVSDEPRLRACDVEFGLPKPNYTLSTLRFLCNQHPENQFVLIVGADNVAVFDKWRDYDQILAEFEVWAYPRQGYPMHSDQFPQIRFVDAPLFNVSATEIRQRLAQRQSIEGLVSEIVAHEIVLKMQGTF